MYDFFEYKYIAIDTFYNYVCKENMSYAQAGGRCMVDFSLLLSANDVRTLAIYSTILFQVAKYTDYLNTFENEFKTLIKLVDLIDINKNISENQREYLKDDLDFIKYKYINLVN